MTIAINSTSILNGIMCIDATVTAPAGHKLRSFFITCGGEYAYYLIPRTYYVSDASAYTQNPQVILSGRSISKFPLAQWPNGDISFIVSAKYQNITTSVTVTESAPVTVNVTNTFYEAPQTPDPIVQPGGQLQQPVVTVFDVPASVGSKEVPVTLSAKDNNSVAGYYVGESATTPLASNPDWAVSITQYTTQKGGAVTLYAWAKDAEGNISDPVTAQVTVPESMPTVTLRPVVSAPSLQGVSVGVIGAAEVILTPSVTVSPLIGVQVGNITTASVSLRPSVTVGALFGVVVNTGSISAASVTLRPSVSASTLTGVQVGSMSVPAVTLRPAVAVGTLSGIEAVFVGNIPAVSTTMQIQVNPPTLRGITAGTAIRAPDGSAWDIRDIYGAPMDIRAIF